MGKVLKAVAVGAVAGAVIIGTGGIGAGLLSTVSLYTGSAFVAATGIGISAAVAGAMGGALIGGALAVASSAIAPGLPTIKQSGGGIAANSIQPMVNAPIVYGRARVGGPLCFYHARQIQEDGEPTDYRYFVVALAAHEVHAIEAVHLNDTVVTLGAGNVVTNGDYANNCWIWAQTGSDSDTPPAAFTSETGGRWTSDHRGRGIAKLYVKFKLTEDVIKQGIPKMTAVVLGKKVFDPRTNTTAYSNNAALCFYDWMRTPRVDGGFGLTQSAIDWSFVAQQADVCDELVTTKSGNERRYCIDGVIDTGAGADAIRDALLLAMAGSYTESGGLVKAYPGKFREVTGTVREDAIVGSLKYDPLLDDSNRMDGVRGVFISEANKWQPVEFPPVGDTASNDRVLDIELPFTKSGAAAQRIAKIILKRTEAQRALAAALNMSGLKIECLDNITVYHPRYPHVGNMTWQVTGWQIAGDFSISITANEERPDFYEWDVSEEREVLVPALALQEPDLSQIGAGAAPQNMTATPVSSSQIDVSFTMPPRSTAWVLYRNTVNDRATASLIANGNGVPGQTITHSDTGLDADTQYFYWAQTINFTGYFGGISAPAFATATTPS